MFQSTMTSCGGQHHKTGVLQLLAQRLDRCNVPIDNQDLLLIFGNKHAC